MKMKMKNLGILAVLTLLLVIAIPTAPVPIAAQSAPPQLPTLTAQDMQTQLPYVDPTAYPLMEVFYQMLNNWQVPQQADGTPYIPEWANLPTSTETLPTGGGATVSASGSASAPAVVVGSFAASAGTASSPALPPTFTTQVNLASNSILPTIFTPSFNPSIAADPSNITTTNVGGALIEGQFDVAPAQPFLRCSIRTSVDGGTTWSGPTFLPLVPQAPGSFCTRALVAFSSTDDVAYVLWTSYSLATSTTNFLMGETAYNVATNTFGALTGLAGGAFPTVVRAFPMSQELPITPSLAVFGAGAIAEIHIAYVTFKGVPLTPQNEIDTMNSATGNVPFAGPTVLRTVNQVIPGPRQFLLGPSNAYLGRNRVNVAWYDSGPTFLSGLFFIGHSASTDNGNTNAVVNHVPVGFAVNGENGGFVQGKIITAPFTFFPHLAADTVRGYEYLIDGYSFPAFPHACAPGFAQCYKLFFMEDNGGNFNTLNTAAAPCAPDPLNPANFVCTAAGTRRAYIQNNFENPHTGAASDEFFPAIAIESDGTVHTTWADRRGPTAALGALARPDFQILYAASYPFGPGFGTAPLVPVVPFWTSPQVADQGNALLASGFMEGAPFSGEFFSLAVNHGSGGVHPAWTAVTNVASTALGGPPPLTLFADNTYTNTGVIVTPVGGAVLSVNNLALLAPYLAVAVFATLGLAYALRRRFRSISLPQIPSINR